MQNRSNMTKTKPRPRFATLWPLYNIRKILLIYLLKVIELGILKINGDILTTKLKQKAFGV